MKSSKPTKKGNKSHLVGTRLNDEQYAEFMDKLHRCKIKQSTYLRELITKGKVDIRYDGQEVIQNMYEIQDNMNNYSHAIMDRLELMEHKAELLEAQVNIMPQELVPAPFRIDLERLGVDVSTLRNEYQQQKENYDKELTENVYF